MCFTHFNLEATVSKQDLENTLCTEKRLIVLKSTVNQFISDRQCAFASHKLAAKILPVPLCQGLLTHNDTAAASAMTNPDSPTHHTQPSPHTHTHGLCVCACV